MSKKVKKTADSKEKKASYVDEDQKDNPKVAAGGDVRADTREEECGEEQSADTVDPMADLQSQLDIANDKYLRLSAEFDNYRKRTLKEKMDLIKNASEEVMKSFLPLVDDFERALKGSHLSTDIEAMKQGLVLIYSKVLDFLKSNGVNEIEAVGLELDTDLHEAVSKIAVDDKKQKGKIVDVVEKGYKLNDKVIRFSKVVIGE